MIIDRVFGLPKYADGNDAMTISPFDILQKNFFNALQWCRSCRVGYNKIEQNQFERLININMEEIWILGEE